MANRNAEINVVPIGSGQPGNEEPKGDVGPLKHRRQNRSGTLVKAMRVGAAARASSMLAGNSVAVPYF